MNDTKSQTPVLDLINAAKAAGWGYEPPGRQEKNPDALTIGGTTYSTLLAPCVKVAVGGSLLYYHNGRPWRAYDWPDGRVVIEAIVVGSDYRRNGIATFAVRALQELAAGLGLELWLEATPIEDYKARGQRTITSKKLVKWYKSLGFVDAYPGEGDRILKWSSVQ